MNLFFYVEGQEEELFVNRVLRPYLQSFGVQVKKPILTATSFRIGDENEPEVTVGGVTNYHAIRQDILDQFSSGQIQAGSALTTLIDLYALPTSFPGCTEANSLGFSGSKKASHIETKWTADIGISNFYPYIQVHEFEALILTRPSVLLEFFPEYASQIEKLRTDCARFRTPEEINETRDQSPSHRILTSVMAYQKTDGYRHLQSIGIGELKAHCPKFKEWIELCERGFS